MHVVRRRLARIQHDEIERARRANGAQHVGGGRPVCPPVLIFEQQPLRPAVPGDVEHVRVRLLIEGARRSASRVSGSRRDSRMGS
jgi:hypothetical protein